MKLPKLSFLILLGCFLVFFPKPLLAPPPPVLPFFVPEFVYPYLEPRHYLLPKVEDGRGIRAQARNLIRAELNRNLSGGGKRIRPLLVFLAAGLVGLSPEQVLSIAAVSEFGHVASLIHDDVLDGDDVRRGRPTTRSEVGDKRAVLFGDYLLAELTRIAMRMLPDQSMTDELMEVIQGMTVGEEIQAAALRKGTFGLKAYQEIILHKTGLIFEWAMTSPTKLLMDKPDFLRRRFSAVALALGEMYQRWDDLDPNDYRNNEVNIVRYHAGKERGRGFSSVNGNFSEDELVRARDKALRELQRMAKKVESELVAQVLSGARSYAAFRPLKARHEECAKSLKELIKFLSSPP